VVPAADGEAMEGFARSILEANERARRYFAGSQLRGRARFGAAEDSVTSRLPEVLRNFVRLHRLVDLELTVDLSATLYQMLADANEARDWRIYAEFAAVSHVEANGFALVTQLLPSPVGHLPQQDTAAPSVQSHYRTFIPTMGCSAPVPRIGTLALAGASRLSFSLRIGTTGSRVPQQSLVRVHAASKPGAAQARLQGFARTHPGGHYLPPGSTPSCEFRHVISGSLALVSPDFT
jgi:hypothetical protein